MNNKYDPSWVFTLIIAIVVFLVLAFIGVLGTHTAISAICDC